MPARRAISLAAALLLAAAAAAPSGAAEAPEADAAFLILVEDAGDRPGVGGRLFATCLSSRPCSGSGTLKVGGLYRPVTFSAVRRHREFVVRLAAFGPDGKAIHLQPDGAAKGIRVPVPWTTPVTRTVRLDEDRSPAETDPLISPLVPPPSAARTTVRLTIIPARSAVQPRADRA